MGAIRDRMARAASAAGLVRPTAGLEVRDPRAATSRFAGYSVTGLDKPMVPEWDADSALRWAYYANIVVYRCVQITAQALSSMSFRAGADPDKPGDFTTDAKLAQLLGPPPGGPAPKLAARKFWQWSVAQYLVTGRMCWELELANPGYGNLDVTNIWPLVASKLGAVPTTQGSEWFRAYTYNIGSNQPRSLAPEQVFYAWRPSATDFRQPESVLQAARLPVSIAVMQDRYDYAFLRNDARPASVVVHERFAEVSQRDAFREQWRADYGGVDNAGKTMFLEAGDPDEESSMDVRNSIFIQALGLTQKDAEFIERYKQKLTEICIAFGTPVSKLGDASDRTFSNAKDENRNWWRDTIRPLALEIQDEVNEQLAPRLDGGRYVGWFDTSQIPELRPEPFWQPEPLSNLVGVFVSEREARTLVGLPEDLPDDFEKKAPPPAPAILAGHAATVALPAGEPPPPDKQAEPSGSSATPARGAATIVDIRDAIRVGADLVPGEVRAVESRQAHAERRSLEARQAIDHMDTLEIAWREEFRRLFGQQKANTLSKLRGRRGATAARKATVEGRDTLAEGVFDMAHWNGIVFDAAKSLYGQTALLAARRLNGHKVRALAVDLPDPFDPAAPPVVSFIQQRANQLAGQVNDTTYQAIKDELSDGVAAGENIDDLADRVSSVFDDASDVRATTIARTETVSAYNGVTDTIFDQYGPDVAAGKEWLATVDGRTRDDHADADGQQVGPDEQFTVGGETCDYPGDPNLSPEQSCNCFPAATLVSAVDVDGAYRRWYVGPMVTVRTRSGNVLTGTPNHPVLSHRGWVSLGGLNVGDDLVHGAAGVLGDGTVRAAPDVQGAPASIGQVFDALALMGRSHRVGGRPVDFHGDGRDGDVDVVRTAGDLQIGTHAAGAEQRGQVDLSLAHLVERPLGAGRLVEQLCLAGSASAPSSVGGQGEALAPVSVGVGHADEHGGRPVSGLDAGREQSGADGGTGQTVALAERLLALAGQVSLDEVVDVKVTAFSGHVYNLQTASGWYIANGIVAHNCRCTILVLTPDEMGVSGDTGRQARKVIPLEAAERAAIRMALEQGA